MSCMKNKQKPITPIKTLDIMFRRRYLPNTQYYFANRRHALKVEIEKSSKSFKIPRSDKLWSYIKYSNAKIKLDSSKRLAQPLHLKDNLRIADTRDIAERLFLEETPDDVRAVVKIHPEFFSVIETRPLRCFDDIKLYVNNIRSYAMNRQQIGYRRDLLLKLEESMVEELKEHNQILEKFKQHIKDFQHFLTEDYRKACMYVSKAEKNYAKLVAIDTEFFGYISKLTILKNFIFKLDAIRSVLKTYRRYLLFTAPLTWRQQYDESLRENIQSIQFEAGVFETDNDLVEVLDIDKMVELAKLELKNPLPTHIYFKRPAQMTNLFRIMELQSGEYLTYLSKTDAPFRLLEDRIKQLKMIMLLESNNFKFYIDGINRDIEREQFNEIYLKEKLFRILNESFYDSVASSDTLKLKICIEYVYEQVFGKCEEGHHSLRDPMKILELTYEEYNLKLDSLNLNIVNQARNECFAQDLKMMRSAYKAQRELRSFKEMTSAMGKAFWPPAKYTRPEFKKFLDRKSRIAIIVTEKKKAEIESGIRRPKKYKKLSQEERNGLLMFTNWCEGTNPVPFLREYYTYAKPTFEWVPRKSVLP